MPGLTLAGIVKLEPPPTRSHFSSVQTWSISNPLTPIQVNSVLTVMANTYGS